MLVQMMPYVKIILILYPAMCLMNNHLCGQPQVMVSFDDNTVLNPIYTPGPTDIENGNTLLTLTVVGAEVCGTVADQVELTIFETTTANAGVDADICPGLNYTLSDATASNYVAVTWSTNGDGTFDDANC